MGYAHSVPPTLRMPGFSRVSPTVRSMAPSGDAGRS